MSSSGGNTSLTDHHASHLHDRGAAVSSSAVPPFRLPAAPAAPAAMDLFDFLDFLLAWEHRGTPQGLHYFWAVLDVRRQDYLDRVGVIRPSVAKA